MRDRWSRWSGRTIGMLLGVLAVLALLLWGGWELCRRQGTPLPVLMYHHFEEYGPCSADSVVSADRFREQLLALKAAGYTAVDPFEIADFVEKGVPLPDKPVLITMDDGYVSNLEIAAPILEECGMKATVFTIGAAVGRTTYPGSQTVLDPPRFGWEQARPWVEKGVLCVQSHTYEMHHRSGGEWDRDGVLQKPGESERDYCVALRADVRQAEQGLKDGLGVPLIAVAFPYGLWSCTAVEEFRQAGVKMTFSTQYGCSRIRQGQADTMQLLDRWGIADQITGQQLVQRLAKLERQAVCQEIN